MKKLLLFCSVFVALPLSTSFAGQGAVLENPSDLSMWRVWTNDSNLESGWKPTSAGAILQDAHNSDKEEWGDRYLVREWEDSLLNGETATEITLDLNFADYRGRESVWAGLGLFIDPSSPGPGSEGRLFVIVEQAEAQGPPSLEIHAKGWMSDSITYPDGLPWRLSNCEWFRLVVRLELDEQGEPIISAKLSSPELASTVPWLLQDVKLPDSVNLENRGLAIGASAQHGYGVNPKIAFDNLFISSSGPLDFSTIPLPVTEDPEVLDSRLEYVVATMDRRPDTRDAVVNRVEFLSEAQRVLELSEKTNHPLIDPARNAELLDRTKTALNVDSARSGARLAAPAADASASETVARAARSITTENSDLRTQSSKQLRAVMNDDSVDSDIRKEAHLVLCRVLFENPEKADEYWQATDEFIAKEVIPEEVDDIMLNQAVWLERQGQFQEQRRVLDGLMSRFPTTDLLPVVLMGYSQSLLNDGQLEEVGAQAGVILNSYAEGTPEALVANLYYGVYYASLESPDYTTAATYFDKVIDGAGGYVESPFFYDVMLNAISWRHFIAKYQGDSSKRWDLRRKTSRLPRTDRQQELLSTIGIPPKVR